MHEPIYWRSDMGLVDQLLPVQEQELIHRRSDMRMADQLLPTRFSALKYGSAARLRFCR